MTNDHDEVWQRVSRKIFRAQGRTGEAPLQPVQTPLAELGLDSLKLIEIVYELETFYQLDVDEDRLAELERTGDLIELFVSARVTKDDAAARERSHEINVR